MYPDSSVSSLPLTLCCCCLKGILAAPFMTSTSIKQKDRLKAFEVIKSDIMNSTIKCIDPDLPFTVETDASVFAIAATLTQSNRPVAYFYRVLSLSEKNHSSVEKEAQAIVEFLRKWRHYLIGLMKNVNETAECVEGVWDSLEIDLSQVHNTNSTGGESAHHEVDMWSVMWYLGAFGGLVTFFLIVTCSEWCFGNHMYTRHGVNELYISAYQSNFHQAHRVSDTPPPAYDLFAPPSYSDLFGKDSKKRRKISVFIIPVHRRQSTSPAS